MEQLSFASLDYAAKKKRTKRDVFLAEMAAVVPSAGRARSCDRALVINGSDRPASPSGTMSRVCEGGFTREVTSE